MRARTWLAGVALVALLVRVPALGRSLWFDEVYSLDMAARPVGDLLEAVRRGDTHPPGYYLLLRVWLGLVPGDLGARVLSLLLGLAHVAALGVVTARLGGRRVGWWAALLAAASPALSWTAYEVRSFALFALLATCAWATLEGVLARGGAWRCALVGLLTAAALYTFYYAAIVVLGLAAYALARPAPWGRRLGAAAGAAVGALLFAPWLPVLADQLERVRDVVGPGRGAARLDAKFLLDRWLWQHLVIAAPWGAWLALGGLGVLGVLVLRERRRGAPPPSPPPVPPARPARSALAAVLALAGAFVLGVLVFALVGGVISRRYVTFLSGVWCVAAALLVERLPPRWARATLAVLVLGGFLQALGTALRGPREDWRGAAAVVRDGAGPLARVAVWPAHAGACARHYADGHGALAQAVGLPDELPPAGSASPGPALEARLAVWLAGRDELWLVRVDRDDGREERDPGQVALAAYVEAQGWTPRPRRTFAGVEVLAWLRPR